MSARKIRASARHVKLRLTPREAEALEHAVGNSLYSEEDGLAVMGSRAKYNVAWDAVNKLRAAMHAQRERARVLAAAKETR